MMGTGTNYTRLDYAVYLVKDIVVDRLVVGKIIHAPSVLKALVELRH